MPELLDADGLWHVIDANYLPGKQLFRMEQLPRLQRPSPVRRPGRVAVWRPAELGGEEGVVGRAGG